ncbi:MAG TPA: HWE histidine kinase domain-containing protein [Xanthobacteraceae bacterium]|nr:HWE histidine kinase domain-containing protein [Xanthobacteraceae bacterium]
MTAHRIVNNQKQPPPFNKLGAATVIRVLKVAKDLQQYPILGYTMAFVTIGLATLLQWLAKVQFDGSPFLTIYPAVIAATLIGGRWPGFLAAILAGVSQWCLFIPTLHWLAIASYAFDASVCVMLIDYINRTLDLLLANIDREKQAKQHQYLLAKELHHRIQNLFTVIQGVIRFSLSGEGAIQKSVVRQELSDRLQSMSVANRAITDSMGDGVRLLDLVNNEIRGFESQFEIAGGRGLVLGAQMTQDLSLILHELVTNALKYGALTVPQGRVDIDLDWSASLLTFKWQERGGPLVTEPDRTGFGRRILDTFAKSFCQKVDISYDPGGYRYTLQIRSEQVRGLPPMPIASAARDVADAAPVDREPSEARAVRPLVRQDASEVALES